VSIAAPECPDQETGMNGRPPPSRPEDAPGHYGPGYGEHVPENAPPRPAPATDDEDPDANEPSDGR
jgi:hypothetical protein